MSRFGEYIVATVDKELPRKSTAFDNIGSEAWHILRQLHMVI